jgi:hypothetical protein
MIRQREFLGRNRHRIALVAVLAALSLAVVLEHSGVEHPQMGNDMGGPVVSMCLAIVGMGAVVIGAVAAFRGPRLQRGPLRLARGPVVAFAIRAREAPPPRAGPARLQVFLR